MAINIFNKKQLSFNWLDEFELSQYLKRNETQEKIINL